MSDLLDRMMTLGAESIAREVGKKGPMLSVFHVMYQDGHSGVIGAAWANSNEKVQILDAIKKSFIETNAIAYCFTTEAWTALEIANDSRSPSERPDRKEIFMAFASDGTTKLTRVWDINRTSNGRVKSISEQNTNNSVFEGFIPNMLN